MFVCVQGHGNYSVCVGEHYRTHIHVVACQGYGHVSLVYSASSMEVYNTCQPMSYELSLRYYLWYM